MALKLSAGFKNITPEFWLRVQENFDLAKARKHVDTARVKVFGSQRLPEKSKWQCI